MSLAGLFALAFAPPGAAQDGALFSMSAPGDWKINTGDELFEAEYATSAGPVTYGLATARGAAVSGGRDALVKRLKDLITKEDGNAAFFDGPAYEQQAGDARISGAQFFASYESKGKPYRQWYVVFPRPDGEVFHIYQYSAPEVVYDEYEDIAREALRRLQIHAAATPPATTPAAPEASAQQPAPRAAAPPAAAPAPAPADPVPVNNCDRLAAAPEDPKAVAPGLTHEEINVEAAYEACRRALAEHPDEPRLLTQMARTYLSFTDDRNNPGEAVRLYRRAADTGYPHALYSLGMLAKDGYLAAPGRHFRQEAAHWFDLAVKQGHVEAMVYLAIVLEQGEGMPPEYGKAAELFLAALKKGSDGAREALLAYPESRSPQTLRAVQEKLFSQGYYHGEADGKFGPKTRKALEAYAPAGN